MNLNGVPKYILVPEGKDHIAVQITAGRYRGVRFKYTVVRPEVDESTDQASMSIMFEVLDRPGKVDDLFREKIVAAIFEDIMTNLSAEPTT